MEIIVLSAGVGVYDVDFKLRQITKQRVLNSGVGVTLINVTEPPFHRTPLFRLQSTSLVRLCVVICHLLNRTVTFHEMRPSPTLHLHLQSKGDVGFRFPHWILQMFVLVNGPVQAISLDH